MTNIIETKFGTLVNTSKIASGSASTIKKSGAFYNFSIRVDNDDIREYSFENLIYNLMLIFINIINIILLKLQ